MLNRAADDLLERALHRPSERPVVVPVLGQKIFYLIAADASHNTKSKRQKKMTKIVKFYHYDLHDEYLEEEHLSEGREKKKSENANHQLIV